MIWQELWRLVPWAVVSTAPAILIYVVGFAIQRRWERIDQVLSVALATIPVMILALGVLLHSPRRAGSVPAHPQANVLVFVVLFVTEIGVAVALSYRATRRRLATLPNFYAVLAVGLLAGFEVLWSFGTVILATAMTYGDLL